jgi:hypothetical protein
MNWETIRQAAASTMTAPIARPGVATVLARVEMRTAPAQARRVQRSPESSRRNSHAPPGRSARRSVQAAARFTRSHSQVALGRAQAWRRTSGGWARSSARLATRSALRVHFSGALSTGRMRRRAAAIIARRSGSFVFAARFAGPAGAFFLRWFWLRRSRSVADRFDFTFFRFKTTTLTLRTCQEAFL